MTKSKLNRINRALESMKFVAKQAPKIIEDIENYDPNNDPDFDAHSHDMAFIMYEIRKIEEILKDE